MQSDRNPFEALCAIASRDGWCWKIPCTTCANQQFRTGLTLISCNVPLGLWDHRNRQWPGVLPGSRAFESHFLLRVAESEHLGDVLANANLQTIRAEFKDQHRANTPMSEDWLGYLGVALEWPLFLRVHHERVGHSWRKQLDQMAGIQRVEMRPLCFRELEEYENRLSLNCWERRWPRE